MLLSLFCGAGGLDIGFEEAGYEIGLAFDIRNDSIASYNYNRKKEQQTGHCADIRNIDLNFLDDLHGTSFNPTGIIGGPPCQSFSRANKSPKADDPRHNLPFVYASIIEQLNKRKPIPFFAFENVPGINEGEHKELFEELKKKLISIGFNVNEHVINAINYGVPQYRERLIMVGINKKLYGNTYWLPPEKLDIEPSHLTVGHTFKDFPEPTFFQKDLIAQKIPFHPNHWCMQPKSKKFITPGALLPGKRSSRSFKTLSYCSPSITVAYGNREVHIHPNCKRRLSVYEAMRLQGFPKDYVLLGSLSSQITQVSEAVPPPMAKEIAKSINMLLMAENLKTA